MLTKVPDVGEAAWVERFNHQRKALQISPYYALVIVNKNTDQLVATGTVFMEYKFIRGNGIVGHIEDIAVDASMQGKSLGKRIIQALTGVSEKAGAYKTILDCSEDNQGELVHMQWTRTAADRLLLSSQASTKSAATNWPESRWQSTRCKHIHETREETLQIGNTTDCERGNFGLWWDDRKTR